MIVKKVNKPIVHIIKYLELGDLIQKTLPILRFKVRSTYAWRARRARVYNGGLGAEPPTGSRGRAPGQGVRGRSPPEAESLLAFQRPITARKITSFTVSSKLRVCDVSSTFNRRIPNISLLKTGLFKVAEVDCPSARL